LAKIFKYLFVHQKENPQKPQAKVNRIRKEMKATLENRKKTSKISKKCSQEEGGASGSRVKKEHENTEARVQKMMRGRVASFTVLTLVHASR
jgi:ribosome assembly protein YihI (activator of Der GTPase)